MMPPLPEVSCGQVGQKTIMVTRFDSNLRLETKAWSKLNNKWKLIWTSGFRTLESHFGANSGVHGPGLQNIKSSLLI